MEELIRVLRCESNVLVQKLGLCLWSLIFLSPCRMSPFLAWVDFHAHSRFARSTIPEKKWGTTRSLLYCLGYTRHCLRKTEKISSIMQSSDILDHSEQPSYKYPPTCTCDVILSICGGKTRVDAGLPVVNN